MHDWRRKATYMKKDKISISFIQGKNEEVFYDIFLPISEDVVTSLNSTKCIRKEIVSNISKIFSPKLSELVRFNSLERMPEIFIDGKYRPMNDSDDVFFNTLLMNNLESQHIPRTISMSDSNYIFNFLLKKNSVDPFYKYVSSIEWDGVPRVRRWFIDGLGAYIPGVDKDTSDRIIEEATQAWFVGTMGRSNGNSYKLEIVPVLIGDQGTYKSTYVSYTAMSMVEEDWYNSTVASLKDPKFFFESIRGAKVVEWSESTQLKRAEDVELLKAFISQEKDTYRPSYARNSETYNRQFSCIMTSNEKTLFNDDTGNRRFIPMVCSDNRARWITYENMEENLYDVQQVWAEALALLRSGAKAYMPSDVERLAMCQTKKFTKSNEFFDEVISQLDENYPNVGDHIEVKTLKHMISNIKYDFDEMRNRTVKTEDLIKYANGEWIFEPKKNIWVNGKLQRRNIITRVKPPSEGE